MDNINLQFDGPEMLIQTDLIQIDGGQIPINLYCRKTEDGGKFYEAEIDGVLWYTTEAAHHAMILYTLLRDNVTKYMNYIKT